MIQLDETLLSQAKAIAKPEQDKADSELYSALRRLRVRDVPLRDHVLSDAADQLAASYVDTKVKNAAEAVEKVIRAKNISFSEQEIITYFRSLRPPRDEIKTKAFQQAHGFGIPTSVGYDLDMNRAYESASERAESNLVLLASAGALGQSKPSLLLQAAPEFSLISTDAELTKHLARLWDESTICYDAGADMAAVIMLGGLIEGVFLAKCLHDSTLAACQVAPREKDGTLRDFSRWTLSNFIDVAAERGWIHKTRSEFSDVLRNYRNFVHSDKALRSGHDLDHGTATICRQVVSETLRDLGLLT